MNSVRSSLSENETQRVQETIAKLTELKEAYINASEKAFVIHVCGVTAEVQDRKNFPKFVKNTRFHQKEIESISDSLALLHSCLEGRHGICPDRNDLELRKRIDLEISQLIGQRNTIYLRCLQAHEPDSLKADSDRLIGLRREIDVLSTRRSEIDVRIFSTKRIHAIITAMTV